MVVEPLLQLRIVGFLSERWQGLGQQLLGVVQIAELMDQQFPRFCHGHVRRPFRSMDRWRCQSGCMTNGLARPSLIASATASARWPCRPFARRPSSGRWSRLAARHHRSRTVSPPCRDASGEFAIRAARAFDIPFSFRPRTASRSDTWSLVGHAAPPESGPGSCEALGDRNRQARNLSRELTDQAPQKRAKPVGSVVRQGVHRCLPRTEVDVDTRAPTRSWRARPRRNPPGKAR